MTEDRQRVRRLLEREERADAPAEGSPDERESGRAFGPERVPRGAELVDLRRVLLARPAAAGRERDRARLHALRGERLRERAEDRLLGGAAVARGEHDRARQRAFGAFFAFARGEASVARRSVAACSDASVRSRFALEGAAEPPPATRATDLAARGRSLGSFCSSPIDSPRTSPTLASRAAMFAIVKASGRPSAGISSQPSGAETGARRIGRTL